jgi:cobalamin biosynthesis protein CbiD
MPSPKDRISITMWRESWEELVRVIRRAAGGDPDAMIGGPFWALVQLIEQKLAEI